MAFKPASLQPAVALGASSEGSSRTTPRTDATTFFCSLTARERRLDSPIKFASAWSVLSPLMLLLFFLESAKARTKTSKASRGE